MPTLQETRAIEYPQIEDLGTWEEPTEGDPDAESSAGSEGAGAPEAGAAVVGESSPGADTSTGEKDTSAAAGSDAGAAADGSADAQNKEAHDAPSAEIAERAAQMDHLDALWRDDPVAFARRALELLPPEARAALMGGQPAAAVPEGNSAPAPAEAPWEALSAAEEHYARFHKAVERLPQLEQAVPALEAKFGQALATRDRFLHEALQGSAVLQARLEALEKLLDVQLPAHDQAKLDAALRDGKKSYRDAVAELYRPELERAVAAKRQGGKARPSTPGNAGNDTPQVTKGMTMAQIFSQQS